MSPTHGRQRSYALLVTAVLAVAIAIRLLPVHWTSYPFNPDAFSFAAYARDTLATGTLAEETTPHGIGFTLVLTMTAEVTGLDPLWVGQPIIALVGAGPPVLAVAFARRLGYGRGWTARSTTIAAAIAGLVLATQGIYLRRTAGVHYETFGLLLVPIVALATHRLFATRRPAWGGVLGGSLVVLPITHHFSTVIGGVAMVFVAALWCRHRLTWSTGALAALLVGSFWAYLGTYYAITRPGHTEHVTTSPGLFLSWVVLGTALTLWLRTTTPRIAQGVVGSVIGIGMLVLVLNAMGVYPGVAATPPALLAGLVPVGALALLAAVGVGGLTTDRTIGPVMLALFVAPCSIVFFALSDGLTPGNAMIARRGQTFVHLSGMILAAVGAMVATRTVSSRLGDRWHLPLRTLVPILVVLCGLVTAPIAFADLHVVAYKGTTTGEEFAATTFAVEHVPGTWAGDDHTTRIAGNYYPARTNASVAPVYGWLHGDPPPDCPTMAQHDWTTVGAQLFPDDPVRLERGVYERWQTEQNVVYTTSGPDAVVIVHPTTPSTDC